MSEGRVCIPLYLHVLVMGTLKIMGLKLALDLFPAVWLPEQPDVDWNPWDSTLGRAELCCLEVKTYPGDTSFWVTSWKNRWMRSSSCFLNAFVSLHPPQQWHWNIPLAVTWGKISFPKCWNVQSIQTSDGWKKSRGTLQFLFKSQCSVSVASKSFVLPAMSR